MSRSTIAGVVALMVAITGQQTSAQTVIHAVPRETVLPSATGSVDSLTTDAWFFRSARVSRSQMPANTWHIIWFDVTSDDESKDQVQQHMVAFDYTPAPTMVRGLLEYRLNDDGIWSSTWVDAFGTNGRLFLCYGMYAPAGTLKWRFRVRSYSDEDLSYKFVAERMSSATCARDGDNDGGTSGTGSGGDFGPFNIYVDGSQGQQAQIAIGIRDHECEDGDIVSVYIGDGFGDRAVFTNTEIFNHWQEQLVTVRAGYYYQVRAVAVNGTGFKGACSHRDVNTGEMRVRSNYSSEISTWEAPGGAERAGIVNIRTQ